MLLVQSFVLNTGESEVEDKPALNPFTLQEPILKLRFTERI